MLFLESLYAARNFGYAPLDFLARIPMECIRTIHLAGGKWIGHHQARRLLDDHLHDVPDPVYALLEEVGARARQPLTVILERDGDYPAIECLLEQLDRAREALATGRARRVESSVEAVA